jgi:hypothetical protein
VTSSAGEPQTTGVFTVGLLSGKVTERLVDEVSPTARSGHAVAWSMSRQSLFLFGGNDGYYLLEDVWEYTPRTNQWVRLDLDHAALPSAARENATAIAPHTTSSIFLTGGTSRFGKEDPQRLLEYVPGQGWKIHDSTPQARIAAGGGVVHRELRPGEDTVLPIESPRRVDPNGTLIGLGIEVEPGAAIGLELMDSDGRTLIAIDELSGAFTTPLLVRRGEQLAVRLSPLDASELVAYELSTASVQVDLASETHLAALDGFDVNGNVSVAANRWDVRVGAIDSSGTYGETAVVDAGWAKDVAIDGQYAYVADSLNDLVVYDIGDPSNPVEVASAWTLGAPRSIAKQGDRVYVATGLMGVQIFDVSNPLEPEWIDNIFLCDIAEDVSAGGGLLAVTSLIDGVSLIAIGDGEPSVLSSYEPEGWTKQTELSGGIVHVLAYDGTVQQLDVTNPRAPRLLGERDDADWSVIAEQGRGFLMVPDYGWFGGDLKTYVTAPTTE